MLYEVITKRGGHPERGRGPGLSPEAVGGGEGSRDRGDEEVPRAGVVLLLQGVAEGRDDLRHLEFQRSYNFV